jgi:hypothetical protein
VVVAAAGVVDSAAVAVVVAAEIVVAVVVAIVAVETVAEIAAAAGTKSFSISKRRPGQPGRGFFCAGVGRAAAFQAS